jgi:Holliday junction resolvasome RuvABC endonuclease subunit
VVDDTIKVCPLDKATDRGIWETVKEWSQDASIAVLEKVHAMPKQGVSSTFKFGTSFGELKMALVAAGIRFELVTPVQWQTFMGCRSKGDKNVTKQRAEQLFPGLKVTHKTADALLLAEMGRRKLAQGEW